jgi:hypothetical protein
VHTKDALGIHVWMYGYTMRLEFGNESNGLVPAKLYLCTPDLTGSYVAGNYVAGNYVAGNFEVRV